MTGWRCAAVLGNPDAVSAYWRLKTNVDSGLFEAIQLAGVAALDGPRAAIEEMNAIYERRRDLVVGTLGEIGVDVTPPRGTIYVWAPVPEGHTSTSFAELVLEQAAVVVSPGSMYGPSGEGFFGSPSRHPTTGSPRLSSGCESISSERKRAMSTPRSAPARTRPSSGATGSVARSASGSGSSSRAAPRSGPTGRATRIPALRHGAAARSSSPRSPRSGPLPRTWSARACSSPTRRIRTRSARSTASSSARPHPRRRWSSSPGCSTPLGGRDRGRGAARLSRECNEPGWGETSPRYVLTSAHSVRGLRGSSRGGDSRRR